MQATNAAKAPTGEAFERALQARTLCEAFQITAAARAEQVGASVLVKPAPHRMTDAPRGRAGDRLTIAHGQPDGFTWPRQPVPAVQIAVDRVTGMPPCRACRWVVGATTHEPGWARHE